MENFGDVVAGGIILVVAVIYIVMFIGTIITLIAMAKMVHKAGKPAWSVIVPIYNFLVLSDMAVGKGLLGILCLIPFVNFIAIPYLFYKLAESFGASPVLCIVNAIFPVIGYFIFGFGGTQYVGPASSVI